MTADSTYGLDLQVYQLKLEVQKHMIASDIINVCMTDK